MKLPIDYASNHHSVRKQARLQYSEEQKGKCWHCKFRLEGGARTDMANKKINKNLFPRGFFSNPVHLHHSHETGLTIGAVHAQCNAVLWQYHGE
jgi:hypothetical protein